MRVVFCLCVQYTVHNDLPSHFRVRSCGQEIRLMHFYTFTYSTCSPMTHFRPPAQPASLGIYTSQLTPCLFWPIFLIAVTLPLLAYIHHSCHSASFGLYSSQLSPCLFWPIFLLAVTLPLLAFIPHSCHAVSFDLYVFVFIHFSFLKLLFSSNTLYTNPFLPEHFFSLFMKVLRKVGFGVKRTNLNFQVRILFGYQDTGILYFFFFFLIVYLYFSLYMSGFFC